MRVSQGSTRIGAGRGARGGAEWRRAFYDRGLVGPFRGAFPAPVAAALAAAAVGGWAAQTLRGGSLSCSVAKPSGGPPPAAAHVVARIREESGPGAGPIGA